MSIFRPLPVSLTSISFGFFTQLSVKVFVPPIPSASNTLTPLIQASFQTSLPLERLSQVISSSGNTYPLTLLYVIYLPPDSIFYNYVFMCLSPN